MATPLRSIRVPDDIWDPAIAKATAEETDLSTVIRDFLADYNSQPAGPRKDAS